LTQGIFFDLQTYHFDSPLKLLVAWCNHGSPCPNRPTASILDPVNVWIQKLATMPAFDVEPGGAVRNWFKYPLTGVIKIIQRDLYTNTLRRCLSCRYLSDGVWSQVMFQSLNSANPSLTYLSVDRCDGPIELTAIALPCPVSEYIPAVFFRDFFRIRVIVFVELNGFDANFLAHKLL
jgi:hypothetical protein